MSIPPLTQWPADLLYEYHERVNIKEFEARMERSKAEAQAISETWPQTEMFVNH